MKLLAARTDGFVRPPGSTDKKQRGRCHVQHHQANSAGGFGSASSAAAAKLVHRAGPSRRGAHGRQLRGRRLGAVLEPGRSKTEGRAIGIAEERAYGTADEMFAGEKARPDGMDVVAIMSPNDSHYALLPRRDRGGLDIICDKPLATNLDDAARPGEARAGGRHRLLPDLQLHRLSAGPPGDGDGSRRRYRRGADGRGRVHPGLQLRVLSEGERTGDPAWHFVPEKVGQLAGPRRHRQPRPSPRPLRHRAESRAARRRRDHHRARTGRCPPHDHAGVLFRLDNNAPGMMWVTQAGAGAVHGLYYPRLRREGRARMGAGDAEPALPFAATASRR